MKLPNMHLNSETYIASQERRRKILLMVHAISAFVFLAHNITDVYHEKYNAIPLRTVVLSLVALSFFLLYKKGHFEQASYAVLSILAIATIGVVVAGKFDHFTPAFILPFILGAFSLFSWKRGLLFSGLVSLALVLIFFYFKPYFEPSNFLQSNITIFNFLFIFLIVFVFAFYYETTRVDAYKSLINANHKKDLLYNEIHHRVKNNLNIVSSMIAIQSEKEAPKVQEILKISKDRIDAIAMVHSMLYVSHDMEKVNAKLFIEKLVLNVKSSIDMPVDIAFRIKALELSLNEIIPIGLIINELLTNSFKYAFETIENPKIMIVLQIRKSNVVLTYCDNGEGCSLDCKQGLGLRLVDLNIRQLKGNLKINRNKGLCYQITYKRSLHV